LEPIPYTKPYFSEDSREKILKGIDGILSSGRLMGGEYSARLERDFATLAGARHAVSLNSCSTALQICLRFYGVTNREVLVPSASFITDISAIRWEGGCPVLVDMNPQTLSFDLDDLRRKLTPQTRGIIWVHLTGFISPEYAEISTFANENGLVLIEDCAHAHGATIDGRAAGSIGDAGCFSFFPTKPMTTGTGGMISTNDDKLANFARQVRLFGKNTTTDEVEIDGNDWFLDEIRSCVGYYQLQDLPEMLKRRRAVAARYSDRLANQPYMRPIAYPPSSQPAYYQYALLMDPRIDTDKLIGVLKSRHNITVKRIYRPTHKEKFFQDLDNGTLRKTEETLQRSICLPLYCEMTGSETDHVAQCLIAEMRALA
jgi:perosamine synthetase